MIESKRFTMPVSITTGDGQLRGMGGSSRTEFTLEGADASIQYMAQEGGVLVDGYTLPASGDNSVALNLNNPYQISITGTGDIVIKTIKE